MDVWGPPSSQLAHRAPEAKRPLPPSESPAGGRAAEGSLSLVLNSTRAAAAFPPTEGGPGLPALGAGLPEPRGASLQLPSPRECPKAVVALIHK